MRRRSRGSNRYGRPAQNGLRVSRPAGASRRTCVAAWDAAYCGMIRSRLAIPFLYALFFLSGGAGLGYQMVWSRMLSAGLGHEMPAVLAVVGAFMGGMAIGAWVLDHRIARS